MTNMTDKPKNVNWSTSRKRTTTFDNNNKFTSSHWRIQHSVKGASLSLPCRPLPCLLSYPHINTHILQAGALASDLHPPPQAPLSATVHKTRYNNGKLRPRSLTVSERHKANGYTSTAKHIDNRGLEMNRQQLNGKDEKEKCVGYCRRYDVALGRQKTSNLSSLLLVYAAMVQHSRQHPPQFHVSSL